MVSNTEPGASKQDQAVQAKYHSSCGLTLTMKSGEIIRYSKFYTNTPNRVARILSEAGLGKYRELLFLIQGKNFTIRVNPNGTIHFTENETSA